MLVWCHAPSALPDDVILLAGRVSSRVRMIPSSETVVRMRAGLEMVMTLSVRGSKMVPVFIFRLLVDEPLKSGRLIWVAVGLAFPRRNPDGRLTSAAGRPVMDRRVVSATGRPAMDRRVVIVATRLGFAGRR